MTTRDFRIPDDLIVGPDRDSLSALAGPANWGIERFAGQRLSDIADGTGIVVGVIDTGIDAGHPDLNGRVIDLVDFTGGGNPVDRNGHGTHCAGTVAAANPQIGVRTEPGSFVAKDCLTAAVAADAASPLRCAGASNAGRPF